MKVTVTHLKAAWPAGTVPGHVVDLAGVDAIPSWAVGKCVPAADDAEAVSVWEPAAALPEPVAAQAGALTEVEEQAAAEKAALARKGRKTTGEAG